MLSDAIQEVNGREAIDLCHWLMTSNGYREARVLSDGSVAGVQDLLFTRAIVTGCSRGGWGNRFCFDDLALADKRFIELQSEDDVPPGHIAARQGWKLPMKMQHQTTHRKTIP